MLIVSKFKDYYDSVAQTKGIDTTIVYNRIRKGTLLNEFVPTRQKNSIIHFPSYDVRIVSRGSTIYGLNSYETMIVGFCGKIYPLMITKSKVKNLEANSIDEVVEYIYDIDVIEAINKKHGSTWTPFSVFKGMLTHPMILNQFVKHKTPIFIIKESRYKSENFEVNSCLKEIDFFTQMETFTAFQEIEMYISGVLGVDSQKIIEVSDKSKIEGHGFDYKWSFRKEKVEKEIKPKKVKIKDGI